MAIGTSVDWYPGGSGGGSDTAQDVFERGSVVELDNFEPIDLKTGSDVYLGSNNDGAWGVGSENTSTGESAGVSGVTASEASISAYTNDGFAYIRVISYNGGEPAIYVQDSFANIGMAASEDYSANIIVRDNAYTTTKAVKALIASDGGSDDYSSTDPMLELEAVTTSKDMHFTYTGPLGTWLHLPIVGYEHYDVTIYNIGSETLALYSYTEGNDFYEFGEGPTAIINIFPDSGLKLHNNGTVWIAYHINYTF